MVARVASFEGVNAKEAEKTIDQAGSLIRPLVENLDGYQGQLALVSSNGNVLSISFFDSEASTAAQPALDLLRASRNDATLKLADHARRFGASA